MNINKTRALEVIRTNLDKLDLERIINKDDKPTNNNIKPVQSDIVDISNDYILQSKQDR